MARSSALFVAALVLVLVGCADRAQPTPQPQQPAATPPAAAAPPAKTVAIERDSSNIVRESGALVLGKINEQRHAFLADEDDSAIVEMDLETNAIVGSTEIGARPRDVLLLKDGRIAATLPDQAAVAVFVREETGKLREETRIKTADEPMAMALTPDDTTLFVTTGASHTLISISTGKLEEQSRHSLGREPRAVIITSNGERAIVSHAAETFVSVLDIAAKKVTTRDIDNRTMCGGGHCGGARTARGAQAIARVGDRGIVIPTAQSLPVPPGGFTKAYFCPPSRSPQAQAATRDVLDRGGVLGYGIGSGEAGPPIMADLEVLDGKDASFYGIGTHPLHGGDAPKSCLLPRAAIASGKDSVLVACLGSSTVQRTRGSGEGFDLSVHRKAQDERMIDGMIANLKTEAISVPAGPTGLVTFDDNKAALVWSAFARKITRLDLSTAKKAESTSTLDIPRKVAREDAWLAGRTLFFTNHDKRISADGRACASCHIDGRDDGLTWKTPMGMRRTRMLAGQTTAGPYGWKGDHATLDAHMKTTLKNLQGTGLPDEEIAQLATYVTSIGKMPNHPNPNPPNNADVSKGKELFASAECANCHAAGGQSDRQVHDVGTGGTFLTPTLAGISTRGQLMHDGRYKNLDTLLAGATSMGRGSQLSPDDRQALVKYLETL